MTHRRTAKKARTEEPDAQPPQPATEVVQEADQTTEMKTEPSDTMEVDLSSSNSSWEVCHSWCTTQWHIILTYPSKLGEYIVIWVVRIMMLGYNATTGKFKRVYNPK